MSVQLLIEALAGGQPEHALSAFAPNAVCAYWDGAGEETAARSIARGTAAIRDALERSAGSRPQPLVSVHDGADCFVEGRMAAPGHDVATFVASIQLNGDGTIARCLCFHGPAVEPSPTWQRDTRAAQGAAQTTLERYFRGLRSGDFEAASDCFSMDCLYSHPPYWPGTPRVEFRGRDELLAGFRRRGMRPVRQTIVRCVQQGSECFIEGVVDGNGSGGSFVSSLSLDADGLIQRYVAFYSASRVVRVDRP
jgi:hypothetical protein